jgi:phenylpyruvate tautomerase PptA (4-oxalocrotonate tautomerase family)
MLAIDTRQGAERSDTMPMIDVYAPEGVFEDKHTLARRLAAAVMAVEQVPEIAMFRQNTAAFIHELPADAMSNVDGGSDYVRVQVLTNAGALDRHKQIAMVVRLTELIAEAPGKPPAPERIWVELTEAPDGAWGLWGHAHTNAELVAAARRELAQAVQSAPAGKE